MNKEPLNLYNLNAPNFSVINWKYDYYSLIQNKGFLAPVHSIMGVSFANGIHTGNFKVYKVYLPNGNVAWKVSSSFFKHYYTFLLNPIVSDYVVTKGDMKYYTNVCIKCEKATTSLEPLPKITYMGIPNAVYLCNKCKSSNEVYAHIAETTRKKTKPNRLETEITKILKDIHVKYEREKVFNLGYMNKVVDFYIPCGKVIIEGNGIAYHSNQVETKINSNYGAEAFFINVMKDVISAYELTSQGYYVYVITDADLMNIEDAGKILLPNNISQQNVDFIKDDLYQILSLRGCKPKIDFDVFQGVKSGTLKF